MLIKQLRFGISKTEMAGLTEGKMVEDKDGNLKILEKKPLKLYGAPNTDIYALKFADEKYEKPVYFRTEDHPEVISGKYTANEDPNYTAMPSVNELPGV